jgi:hypothetical protein
VRASADWVSPSHDRQETRDTRIYKNCTGTYVAPCQVAGADSHVSAPLEATLIGFSKALSPLTPTRGSPAAAAGGDAHLVTSPSWRGAAVDGQCGGAALRPAGEHGRVHCCSEGCAAARDCATLGKNSATDGFLGGAPESRGPLVSCGSTVYWKDNLDGAEMGETSATADAACTAITQSCLVQCYCLAICFSSKTW